MGLSRRTPGVRRLLCFLAGANVPQQPERIALGPGADWHRSAGLWSTGARDASPCAARRDESAPLTDAAACEPVPARANRWSSRATMEHGGRDLALVAAPPVAPRVNRTC